METRFKRFLSLALAIVMVIGMMPTNIVYATETGDSGSDVVEETTAAPTEAPTEEPTEAPSEEATEETTEETTEEATEETTEEATEETTEEATEETTEEVKAELSGETRKIYFHNVEGWDEVWAAWSFDEEDFEDVAHPGEEMNSNTELEGVYVIKVPVEADGVLFSDGIEVTEALLEQERLEGVTVTHEIEVRLAGDKFYNLYQNEAWANYAKTVEALEATEGTEAPTEDPAVSEVQAMIAGLPTEVNSEAEYQATKNTLAAIDEIVESDSFPADAYQTLDWAKIEAAYGALDAYEQEDRSQVQLDGNTVRHHGIIISEADLVSELNKISGETVVYTAAGTAYYPDATKLGYTVSNGTKSQNINAGNDVTWLEDGQNYTVTYYVMSGSFGKLQYTQHSFTFTYEIYQIVTAAAVDTNGNAVPGGGVKVTVNGTTTTLANGDTLEVDYNTPVTVETVAR